MVILAQENVLEHAPKHALAHRFQVDARIVQMLVPKTVVVDVLAVVQEHVIVLALVVAKPDVLVGVLAGVLAGVVVSAQDVQGHVVLIVLASVVTLVVALAVMDVIVLVLETVLPYALVNASVCVITIAL